MNASHASPRAVWAVYPSDQEPFELARLDPHTGARTATVLLSGAVPEDTKQLAIGFGSVWVVSEHRIVHRVDLATATVQRRFELTDQLDGITMSAESVWVSSSQSGGRLVRIDPRTHATLTVVSPAYPRRLTTGPEGVWISHGSRMTLFDPRAGRPLASHDLGGYVLAVCTSAGAVWAATRNETPVGERGRGTEGGLLFRISAEAAMPVAPIEGRTSDLAAADGGVWLASGSVKRIDATSGAITATVEDRIDGPLLAVGPYLWAVRSVEQEEQAQIIRFDPATGEITPLGAPTPHAPHAFALE